MAILRSTSSSAHKAIQSVAEERATVTLTDDMIAEIILKLPVKSVARSQCVAKTWHAAISDDYLRRRLRPQLSVVYFPDDPSNKQGPRFASAAGEGGGVLEDRDLGFLPFRDGAAVVCDACNGMLLLRAGGAAARFVVADPVTRRWVALPPPPSDDAMLSVLAFDPSGSGHHYHVVSFTAWRERGARLEVFSSEAWAWDVRDAEFGVDADDLLCGAVHVHDGAVYLLASNTDRAVRMDVGGDEVECAVVQLPEPVDGDGRVAHSGGRLHYVTSDGGVLKVWVQEAGGEKWRLKHAVKIDDVVEGAGCRGEDEVRFLAMHPDKDAVYFSSPWKLVEYDLARKEVTGSWQFDGKGHSGRNRVVKTWLVPSSFYLSDCLADRRVQC